MTAAMIAPANAPKLPLLQHFSSLKDPRQNAKVLYPLEEIVLLLVCATVAGGDDLVELRESGVGHLAFLRGYLPYRDEMPNHDTLGDVLAAIDAEFFKACVADWVTGLQSRDPDVIGIDGKTSRRTHNRGKGHKPLHLVSASWRSPAAQERRAASGWFSDSRRRPRSPMKSRLIRYSWNASC